ncbi:MAG: hypothetical protein M0Z78_08735 [Betaproteobacteria bacterium]|nr:hypothetical protein [Betaproteobacteria bacterium]
MENQDQIAEKSPEFFSFLTELMRDPETVKAAAESFEMQRQELDALGETVQNLNLNVADIYEMQGAISDQVVVLAEIIQKQEETISTLLGRMADLERTVISLRLQ